jgi:hypothetical protein
MCKKKFCVPIKIGNYLLLEEKKSKSLVTVYEAHDLKLDRNCVVYIVYKSQIKEKETLGHHISVCQSVEGLRVFVLEDRGYCWLLVLRRIEGQPLISLGRKGIEWGKAINLCLSLSGLILRYSDMSINHGGLTTEKIYVVGDSVQIEGLLEQSITRHICSNYLLSSDMVSLGGIFKELLFGNLQESRYVPWTTRLNEILILIERLEVGTGRLALEQLRHVLSDL